MGFYWFAAERGLGQIDMCGRSVHLLQADAADIFPLPWVHSNYIRTL